MVAMLTALVFLVAMSAVSFGGTSVIEVDGRFDDWEAINCKAIDGIYDDHDPVGNAGDIMAFYADEQETRLVFRVGMFTMTGLGGGGDCFREAGTDIYVLLDFAPGGTMEMPGRIDHRVPIMWDTAVRLGYGDRGEFEVVALDSESGGRPAGLVRAAAIEPKLQSMECSIDLPAGFAEAAARAAGVDAASQSGAKSEIDSGALPHSLSRGRSRHGRALGDQRAEARGSQCRVCAAR
jgi:hypothetical protein